MARYFKLSNLLYVAAVILPGGFVALALWAAYKKWATVRSTRKLVIV